MHTTHRLDEGEPKEASRRDTLACPVGSRHGGVDDGVARHGAGLGANFYDGDLHAAPYGGWASGLAGCLASAQYRRLGSRGPQRRRGVPAGYGVVEGGAIPYRSWALAKKQENLANRGTLDPETKCFVPGVPRITYMPYPFQIVQQRDTILILYEYVGAVRSLHMNGNPHPEGPIEWFMGDSRVRWEGITLVVDVVHFTDQTWLDRAGNFHSEALHVVERYTPTGARPHALRGHNRGPEGVHASLEDEHALVPPPGEEPRTLGI